MIVELLSVGQEQPDEWHTFFIKLHALKTVSRMITASAIDVVTILGASQGRVRSPTFPSDLSTITFLSSSSHSLVLNLLSSKSGQLVKGGTILVVLHHPGCAQMRGRGR